MSLKQTSSEYNPPNPKSIARVLTIESFFDFSVIICALSTYFRNVIDHAIPIIRDGSGGQFCRVGQSGSSVPFGIFPRAPGGRTVSIRSRRAGIPVPSTAEMHRASLPAVISNRSSSSSASPFSVHTFSGGMSGGKCKWRRPGPALSPRSPMS